MLVWANTHGGFLAGFGAIGLVLLLKGSENLTAGTVDARTVLRGTAPLWRAVVACVAVTFLTPQGVNLWAFALTEVTHGTNRELIAEWTPTTFGGDTWAAVMLTASTVVLIWLGWLAQRHTTKGRGPWPVFWVLSCVPIIVMAYVSVRHVPIAMIWIAPVLAHLSAVVLAAKTSVHVLWRVFRGSRPRPSALPRSLLPCSHDP